jgi:hypothetical protein
LGEDSAFEHARVLPFVDDSGSFNSKGEPIFPGSMRGGEDGPRGWAATITGEAPPEGVVDRTGPLCPVPGGGALVR